MIYDAARAALAVAAALAIGCTQPADPTPLLWIGRESDRFPASTAASVFWVDVSVNGKAGPQMLVDTGAPLSFFNVDAFGGAIEFGIGRVATLTLGSTLLWKVPVVGLHEGRGLAPNGKPFGGILGHSTFGQFAVSFDYKNQEIALGAAPLPAGLLPPLSLPFIPRGGGNGLLPDGAGIIPFAPSRVVLDASVEGRPLHFLLDTGASWVAVRSSVFDALAGDGRRTLDDEATLATGTTAIHLTRLRSMSLAAEEVNGAVATAGSAIDELMDDLGVEAGLPIDGLLGAPFLRTFYMRVDYPANRLDLHRYADGSHLRDDYQRVGIDVRGLVGSLGTAYLVRRVYRDTDAERKRIAVDDNLLAIDGRVLSSLGIAEVDGMLLGPVGSSHTLTFSDRTIEVLVDELLPLP